MRQVQMYSESFTTVYASCVGGVGNPVKLADYNSAMSMMQGEAIIYEHLARRSAIYQIQGQKTKLDDIVRGALTRRDLKDLYEVQMVGLAKQARFHYDRILLSPPHKKCPYCSLGQATTLDHYLPKSRFPQFSVAVCNLVPCCKDCQSRKGKEYAATKFSQTLHPYFDDPTYFQVNWVYGHVVRSKAITVEFYVKPPSSWPMNMQQRVGAHFSSHRLAERYGIEAASELASVREIYADLRASGDFNQIRILLQRQAKGYTANCPNSWQAALYTALAADNWYCNSPVV